MDSRSCKAKGRRLQQLIRDALYKTFEGCGLEEGDITSTIMGVSGMDILLSPAAARIIGKLAIEAKNVESLNVTGVFWKHHDKYVKGGHLPLLIHKRNNTKPLVTLTLEDFLRIYKKSRDA